MERIEWVGNKFEEFMGVDFFSLFLVLFLVFFFFFCSSLSRLYGWCTQGWICIMNERNRPEEMYPYSSPSCVMMCSVVMNVRGWIWSHSLSRCLVIPLKIKPHSVCFWLHFWCPVWEWTFCWQADRYVTFKSCDQCYLRTGLLSCFQHYT
jgi:hypothetical protein